MLTSHTLLVPHLPTLVIDDQRGHHAGIAGSLRDAARRLHDDAPAAIVVVSARWATPGPFTVDSLRQHDATLAYGGYSVGGRYRGPGAPKLAREIVTAATKAKLRAVALQRAVDTGIAVPMYFLVPARDRPVVATSVPDRPADECRRWGAVIREVIAAHPERIAFVVSGLLSFNMHAWDLKRDVPEAAEFDERALEALQAGRWDGLGAGDARALERVQPETGLRHLEVLRGFLGEDVAGRVLAYEASPGAGQALVEFPVPGGTAADTPAEEQAS